MITLRIKVAPETEGVITALPRYGAWELVSEDYNEDGSGVVVVNGHAWDTPDEVPASVEQVLDTHPGVVEYEYE